MESRQLELIWHKGLCLVLLFAAVIVSWNSTFAQDRAIDTAPATNSTGLCRFAVALPEHEGPLTLGIFSPDGNLIRLLYRDAAVDSIPAGLNGLLISWNGKDDAGQPVPPGSYHARGLVHGKLAFSALPYSEADWHASRLQENNEPLLTPMLAEIQNPFPKNQIIVRAAQDALLETRPLLAIKAAPAGDQLLVTAEGLPIFSIPLDSSLAPENKPEVMLRHGSLAGTAELILISPQGRTSYLLSGLDQLVPLDAGALPMPPEIFVPDSASPDTEKPRP